MLISLKSDLHLEHCDMDIINDGTDVLILSGDILVANSLEDFPENYDNTNIVSYRHEEAIKYRKFLKRCSERFKNVIYVAGNHEYYHGKWYDTLNILKYECSLFPNIHFLEDKSITIDDVIFVGGTLWTDCNKKDPSTMFHLERSMNDYRLIRNERKSYQKVRAIDTIQRYEVTLKFIETVVVNAPRDKKVVVVTHHVPSFDSIAEEYKDDYKMNGGYVSDLSNFILNNPNIVLWTHGHTHTFFDYKIGNTRVVCNPRGYESYDYKEMTGWQENLIIEV